jgi:hypothetical protein
LLQSEKSIYFACFGWKQNSQDLKRNKNERKRNEGKQEKWKQSKAKIVKLRRSSLKPYWWKPKKWWSENKRDKNFKWTGSNKIMFFLFLFNSLGGKTKNLMTRKRNKAWALEKEAKQFLFNFISHWN